MRVARSGSQIAFNTANVLGYEVSGQIAYVELLDDALHDTDPGSEGLTCA